jgi:hypothetical protein
MRNLWRTVVLPKRSPLSVLPPTSDEGFPREKRAGFSFGRTIFPFVGNKTNGCTR